MVQEVENLVANGVKEINLIAQDLAAYGRDLELPEHDLLALLKALVAIDGLKWIRMLYVYPENISPEFIEFFAEQEKIVKYLDIPVQHGSNSVLKRMKRQVTVEEIKNTVSILREKIPSVSIRTTVMVGFPGETEDEFNDLKSLVTDLKFDHLGCFTYSQEEGTVAGRMPDQISEEVKKSRHATIMTIQQKISSESLQNKIKKSLKVLVLNKVKDKLWLGRAEHQAPEVDGLTYLKADDIKLGSLVEAKLDSAESYDLYASL